MAKEGEDVMEMLAMTESTRTDVLVQFTVRVVSVKSIDCKNTTSNPPIVTALTFPLTSTVVFLHPYKLTTWLISVFSTTSDFSLSKYSCEINQMNKPIAMNQKDIYDAQQPRLCPPKLVSKASSPPTQLVWS